MEFTFLDPYLNPSAERKTIKRYATVRIGVGIEAMNEVLLNILKSARRAGNASSAPKSISL